MFQIGLVYVFGGIAKLNWDWLHGWPIRLWLDEGFIGTHPNKEIFIYVISYFGIFFDLLIVPLLLFRKTRVIVFLFALLFHISNKVLFNIGIFPYLSLILTTVYFSPGWSHKLFNKTADSDYLPEYKQLNFEILNKSQQFLLILLIVFIAFQVFFPLRHIL